jgi:lipid-binding SYLF domain-containing protein
MKRIAIGCVFVLTAASAFAALSKDEVKRLHESATILTELRNSPDQAIPEALWNKARCVLVIPSLKKAAFIVGGEYGSGVMSCRTTGWTAPVFMQLAKGSWAFRLALKKSTSSCWS